MGGVRVRVKFEAPPVRYGRQCWFLFEPEQCTVAGDVAFLIAKHFGFRNAQGIQLYMEDFLIPANESAAVIRDNDTLVVRAVEDISATSSDDSSAEEPSSKRVRLDSAKNEQSTSKKKTEKEKKERKAPPLKETAPSNPAKPSAAFTAVPVLKIISKRSKLGGGTHTKFHGSSESNSNETSGEECGRISTSFTSSSTPKQQTQRTTPKSANVRKSNVTTPRNSATKPKAGNKRRSFPSTVGGPSDVHTTRSVVYQESAGSGATVVKGKDIRKSPRVSKNKPKAKEPVITPSKQNGEGSSKDDVGKKSEESPKPSPKNTDLSSPNASTVNVSSPPLREYSSLACLEGAPRIGDLIAYKVLELSTGYTPEASAYKEAKVLGYDNSTKMVKLQLTKDTLQAEKKKASDTLAGKFSLEPAADNTAAAAADDDEGSPLQGVPEEVAISLGALIQPKLLN